MSAEWVWCKEALMCTVAQAIEWARWTGNNSLACFVYEIAPLTACANLIGGNHDC